MPMPPQLQCHNWWCTLMPHSHCSPVECPVKQPDLGSSCSLPETIRCPYGEECCCGRCHPRWREIMCRMTFSFNMMMIMMCRNRMTFPLFNLMMMMKIMIMMCGLIFPFFSLTMVCGGRRWIGYYTDKCVRNNGECGGFLGAGQDFRYFPHQLRFGHPLGGFTVNRAFFTIFRQAEGGGRRAVFTRGRKSQSLGTPRLGPKGLRGG